MPSASTAVITIGDRQHHEAESGSAAMMPIAVAAERQEEGDERAHRHHVAMGEMGEAQDAEDQRDADGAERIDRAEDGARDQHC